jgi:hypothetical protein
LEITTMKRSILVALFTVAVAAPSFADITMKSTVVNKGVGGGSTTTSTTFIKGNKMRTDSVSGDTTRSSIVDTDTMKMLSFDSKSKEVTTYDMTKLAADVGKSVQLSDIKASVKANGKTKQVSGKAADGYDMAVSVPAQMGGASGMKITVSLLGPVWVVKGGPGTAEYMAFYKNAASKGFFFSDPRAAGAQPGQAKAMGEMYRQLAATGGIPYEMEMNVKMSGEGPMAAAFEKMGNISIVTTVNSVETGTLAADLFAVPAGFKLKDQK